VTVQPCDAMKHIR